MYAAQYNDIHVVVVFLSTAMNADIEAEDRGELVSLMEPLLITDSPHDRGPLTDLALDLA